MQFDSDLVWELMTSSQIYNIFEILIFLCLGTDGLWDNLFVEEILEICNSNPNSDSSTLSELIAKAASEASFASRLSPFAKGAKEVGWEYWGGKVDDITVLVGKVKPFTNEVKKIDDDCILENSK